MNKEQNVEGLNVSPAIAKPMLPAVIRLQEINKKNEQKKEYSLGDVMLLDKYENELFARGYSREYIESLSPSYYGR